MSKISIIITTYNSADFILSCLDSVFMQQETGLEIVLVDNGSKDETINLVKSKYPQVKLIKNNNNLGASKARNQAIASTSGEWILTLDCDVFIEKRFFQEILKIVENIPPRVGLIASKIIDLNDGNIYSTGIRRSFLSRFSDIGKGMADRPSFSFVCSVFGACSAAAFYRRRMLEDVKDVHGYFDERLFFLFEDVDLSWRAQKKNWLCMYYPQLKCFHQGNSSATNKKTRQFLSFRNRQLVILKNQHPLVILFMILPYLIYDLPRFLILIIKFKCRFPQYGNFK